MRLLLLKHSGTNVSICLFDIKILVWQMSYQSPGFWLTKKSALSHNKSGQFPLCRRVQSRQNPPLTQHTSASFTMNESLPQSNTQPESEIPFRKKETSILGAYMGLTKLLWEFFNILVLRLLYLFLKGCWLLVRSKKPRKRD